MLENTALGACFTPPSMILMCLIFAPGRSLSDAALVWTESVKGTTSSQTWWSPALALDICDTLTIHVSNIGSMLAEEMTEAFARQPSNKPSRGVQVCCQPYKVEFKIAPHPSVGLVETQARTVSSDTGT
eukprot:5259208-Pyramimonas_sp.AAC.1